MRSVGACSSAALHREIGGGRRRETTTSTGFQLSCGDGAAAAPVLAPKRPGASLRSPSPHRATDGACKPLRQQRNVETFARSASSSAEQVEQERRHPLALSACAT